MPTFNSPIFYRTLRVQESPSTLHELQLRLRILLDYGRHHHLVHDVQVGIFRRVQRLTKQIRRKRSAMKV